LLSAKRLRLAAAVWLDFEWFLRLILYLWHWQQMYRQIFNTVVHFDFEKAVFIIQNFIRNNSIIRLYVSVPLRVVVVVECKRHSAKIWVVIEVWYVVLLFIIVVFKIRLFIKFRKSNRFTNILKYWKI
jgi:hypothetical protein